MAKKGMKRYEPMHEKNEYTPVPIISGKAKSGKVQANPLITDAGGKVFHCVPHSESKSTAAFPAIDNDLAAENFLNDFDMTAADRQALL